MKAKVLGFTVVIISAIMAWVLGAHQNTANAIVNLSEREMSAMRGGIFADCHQPEDYCFIDCEPNGTGKSKMHLSDWFRKCGYGWNNCDNSTQQFQCRLALWYTSSNCLGPYDALQLQTGVDQCQVC